MFRKIVVAPNAPCNWDIITHVRLIKGRRPDTASALSRWNDLAAIADSEGLIPMVAITAKLQPMRNRPEGHLASVRSDLRCWSNARDHGNNSQDKGWLELGYVA